MRTILVLVMLASCAVGCQRFTVRTQNQVAIDGPINTRVTDISPVSPIAGPVRPVLVENGNGGGRVAIVDVDGLLLNTPFVGPMSVGENPVAVFREKLAAIEAEPCTSAVVLRVNSHGGGVSACIAMRKELERFKARTGKPIVACLLDTAAGGAYYLASAADHVVSGPATVTGGIGVILNLFNLRDLMAQFNVIPQGIKAGEYTDIGTSARALDPAERQMLQIMADEFHRQLKTDIARTRPRIDQGMGTTFDGRIFTGSQALARGLVDRIGDLDDAIQIAAQMASPGITARPAVVMYRRNNDPATSIYAVTANVPLQGAGVLPNLPGLERSKLPAFLTLWQPELSIERLCGK